jgi:hypothetical protein
MEVFSSALVSGFAATQLFHGIKCDACKSFPTSQVMALTEVFSVGMQSSLLPFLLRGC